MARVAVDIWNPRVASPHSFEALNEEEGEWTRCGQPQDSSSISTDMQTKKIRVAIQETFHLGVKEPFAANKKPYMEESSALRTNITI
ncbi:hypothetical protein T265_04426 [Opisthorchis viverrini]|uniref:Uncharacterized protein n=1 Tax=Opisthorchis viverrini TaxID=6198 RepID=A0A074ZZU1_OPIVI|nr:hypothetical protein T265_04426 [Opisthorchis viverrini]KER28820.1 hypothetical protein T265_04426 [Opisthorchis viverrini]